MKRRTLMGHAAVAATLPSSFAIAQPDAERTLRFAPQANLSLLDPIYTTAQPTVNHGWAVYDLLFGIDGKHQTKPQMAEGYTLSEDGCAYLIKLRQGLKFHNGEPVRAQDCAPSLRRWAARETIGQTMWQYVDECKAVDDRTLKIVLKRPISMFIDAIARGGASVAFIMPEHVAQTDPFKQITDTTGSGPYRFLAGEYVSGAHAAYARNADYVPRQEPADWMIGGKVAHFDRIDWRIIPDSATASAALQAGEVDWYEQVEPGASVPQVAGRHDVYPGLLFTWRRQVREGKLAPQPKPLFLPIQTQTAEPPALPVPPDRPGAAVRPQIEIELKDGSRIRIDEGVGLASLRRVLTALRG